jgi:hypothetical protein
MASLPIFIVGRFYCTWTRRRHHRRAQIVVPSAHVDNPVDRVKFPHAMSRPKALRRNSRRSGSDFNGRRGGTSHPAAAVDESLSATVPTLIALRIDDKPGIGTTDRDPVQIRERFMRGVGVRKEVKTG